LLSPPTREAWTAAVRPPRSFALAARLAAAGAAQITAPVSTSAPTTAPNTPTARPRAAINPRRHNTQSPRSQLVAPAPADRNPGHPESPRRPVTRPSPPRRGQAGTPSGAHTTRHTRNGPIAWPPPADKGHDLPSLRARHTPLDESPAPSKQPAVARSERRRSRQFLGSRTGSLALRADGPA